LSKEDRAYKRWPSGLLVGEHAIGRMKKFRIFADIHRNNGLHNGSYIPEPSAILSDAGDAMENLYSPIELNERCEIYRLHADGISRRRIAS